MEGRWSDVLFVILFFVLIRCISVRSLVAFVQREHIYLLYMNAERKGSPEPSAVDGQGELHFIFFRNESREEVLCSCFYSSWTIKRF